jgi:3-oxoacyl-(acyl-carrier-protein) synthase
MIGHQLTNLLRENPLLITGAGCISGAGVSVTALWNAASVGKSLAAWREFKIAGEAQRFAVSAAPEIDTGDPALHPVRRMDRCVQLAWLAARQAWLQSGLASTPTTKNIGLMVGSSRGPLERLEQGFSRIETPRYPPSLSADCTFGSLSGALAQALNISGPTATVSATCASGAYAIAFAAEQILLGKADIMLVGGTEAPLHAAALAQLQAAGVLGSHQNPQMTCRPFDVTRNGLALGEGSAFLVMESARSATMRGAKPLAQLSGWSTNIDHSGRAGVTHDGDGIVEAANQSLKLAGLNASQIDHVNLHGTGTQLNDLAEARAIKRVFGAHTSNLPCTSTKPVTGHCLGATPALEAVLCVEALQRQIILPTANCSQIDPACAIHLVTGAARAAKLNHLMSSSLGFWGYHASLIFSKVDA